MVKFYHRYDINAEDWPAGQEFTTKEAYDQLLQRNGELEAEVEFAYKMRDEWAKNCADKVERIAELEKENESLRLFKQKAEFFSRQITDAKEETSVLANRAEIQNKLVSLFSQSLDELATELLRYREKHLDYGVPENTHDGPTSDISMMRAHIEGTFMEADNIKAALELEEKGG